MPLTQEERQAHRRASSLKYHYANKEKRNAAVRLRYRANKEKYLAYGQEWRRKNIKRLRVRDKRRKNECISQKICIRCRKGRASAGTGKMYCLKCVQATWQRHLFREYGLTIDDYNSMLVEQGGCCAVCHMRPAKGGKLVVDHDHTTTKIRALLCGPCNSAIGYVRESASIAHAIGDYIEKHR